MDDEQGRNEKVPAEGPTESAVSDESTRAQRIYTAAESGNFSAVKELLKEDPALVAVRDRDGYTLLHLAAFSASTEGMDFLLKTGMEIDVRNNTGATPLYFAAWNGIDTSVEWLLEHGADVFAEDKDGLTPCDLAEAVGHQVIVDLLSKAERSASDLSEYENSRADAAEDDSILPLLIRENGVLNKDKLCGVLDEEIVSIGEASRIAYDKLFIAYLVENEDLDAAYTDDDFDRIVNNGFFADRGYDERIAALAFYQQGYTNALRGLISLLKEEPSSFTAPVRQKFVGAYDDAPDLRDLTNRQKATLKWLLRFSPHDLGTVIKNFRKRNWS